MATVDLPDVEQRFLMRSVDWSTYQSLLAMFGERPLRITYDRGCLELMSPSKRHERLSRLLGRLVFVLTEELNVPIQSAGSTTLSQEDLDRGLEPDECFFIASESRVRGREHFELGVDPPPDLAVEVDVTRSSLNRMSIYAALGVPEVWRYDGEQFSISVLQADGTYRLQPQSLAFPRLLSDQVQQFIDGRNERDETTWIREFRSWVQKNLLPN